MKSISLIALAFLPLCLFSQGENKMKIKEGKFYSYPEVLILASQIDGDNASGYNKFGYQLGLITGIGLKNNKSLSFSMGLSERGSRRLFNPDEPSLNAFHIRYTSLDLGLLYGAIFNSFHLQGGIRSTYLLGITETENYVPNIFQDYRKIGLLIDLKATYPLNDQYFLTATFQYSLLSLLNPTVSQVNYLLGGGGAFHNVLGLGIVWKP